MDVYIAISPSEILVQFDNLTIEDFNCMKLIIFFINIIDKNMLYLKEIEYFILSVRQRSFVAWRRSS